MNSYTPETIGRVADNNVLVMALEAMDKAQWPPSAWSSDNGDMIPFCWNFDDLTKQSRELKEIHKAVILEELVSKSGFPSRIDLFEHYWREVIGKYYRYVRESEPPPVEIEEITEIGPRGASKEEKMEWEEAISSGKVSSIYEGLEDVFGGSDPHMRITLGLSYWILNLMTNFSLAEEVRIGIGGAGFLDGDQCGFDRSYIQRDNALQLRLAVWWGFQGWKDGQGAPVPCMQNMIKYHIEELVSDGYLRREGTDDPARNLVATYTLSEKATNDLLKPSPERGKTLKEFLCTQNLANLTIGTLSNIAATLLTSSH